MPELIFSNNRIQLSRDEGIGGIQVLHIQAKKIGLTNTVVVDDNAINLIAPHGGVMQVSIHNGNPSVSVVSK